MTKARLLLVVALVAGLFVGIPGEATAKRKPAVGFAVGAAKVGVDPPPGVMLCLGGYGGCDSRRMTGIRDPLMSRALAVSAKGETMILVHTTNIGLFAAYKDEDGRAGNGSYDIRQEIARRIPVPADHVLVQADHSHASPDTIGIWGGVPGSYLKQLREAAVQAAVDAYNARQAARLYVGSVVRPGPTSSYATPPNVGTDDEFRLLMADALDGTRIATLSNYSPHATVLKSGNKQASGDWPEWAAQIAESIYGGIGQGSVATLGREDFGAAGGTDAEREADARARLAEMIKAATKARTEVPAERGVAVKSVFLREQIAQPVLLANYGPDKSAVTGAREIRIDRAVTSPWLEGTVVGTYAGAARVGDVFFGFSPGEPFPQIQWELQRVVQGARMHFHLGATNDFLGYMVTPVEDYAQLAYEGATFLAGCPEEDVVRAAGVHNDGACADHWTLMVSPTIGTHVTCTIGNAAGALGFPLEPADESCPALTATDGTNAPPEHGSVGSKPELPVLHGELGAGQGQTLPGPDVAPTPKVADGSIADWTGARTGFGGTAAYSHGEYVYTDHVFDAYGADNGGDAQRMGILDPLNDAAPETYRLDPIFQADIPGEFGLPTPDALTAQEQYGDVPHQDAADLVEVRLAADATDVHLLARTTTLKAPTADVLVLADTRDGPATPVTVGRGLKSASADVAVHLDGNPRAVDLATGAVAPITAAVNDAEWANAVEASIPRSLVERADGTVRLALATPANVAFRFDEPVRTWWDKAQALALGAGTIDPFFATVDLGKLASGATEQFVPTPGYYDRVFESSPGISTESGQDGIFQHYGVYIPTAYRPGTPSPATWWMHWRGGKAHSAATVSPRIFRDFGEAFGNVVIAPRGRGTATWYLGEGQADFREVWDDAMASFSVDVDRVYLSGHSMGGWASYLLASLYPDRFAATLPVDGPVTQGAFTGLDFPGCDQMRWTDYSPCYVQTNSGDARTQHTYKLLDNLRHVPIGIYQGAIDELVPVSGTNAQVTKLHQLGYRYRYYLFSTYEHYTHPVVDEWMEGARYMNGFRRDVTPERVTYVRDMPFERTVETGPDQRAGRQTTGLSFDFDRAYWMRGLTPVDAARGQARFDGRSLALAAAPVLTVPEAGGPASPGQAGPFTMAGQQWLPFGAAAAATNRFEVTLAGASAVDLDLPAMSLSTNALSGAVTADAPLRLGLIGPWKKPPVVLVDGLPVVPTLADGVLYVDVAAGTHEVTIR